MELMPNIVLIRPGCTDFDEQKRVQGSLDLPMNPRGEQQLHGIVDRLQSIPLDVLYCGPCEPARGTAQALARELDLPLHESDLLRNLDQGLWEGLELEEVRRKFPRVVKQWNDRPERICPPEGEPVAEGIGRIQKAIKKPLKKGVSFGIVASEPIASLIAELIRGEKTESHPLCGSEDRDRIELLRCDPAIAEAIASVAGKEQGQRSDPETPGTNGHSVNGSTSGPVQRGEAV